MVQIILQICSVYYAFCNACSFQDPDTKDRLAPAKSLPVQLSMVQPPSSKRKDIIMNLSYFIIVQPNPTKTMFRSKFLQFESTTFFKEGRHHRKVQVTATHNNVDVDSPQNALASTPTVISGNGSPIACCDDVDNEPVLAALQVQLHQKY